MPKKILITGATGLIGKEAIPFLLKKGYEIYAITTQPIPNDYVHWLKCDLCNYDSLKQVFAQTKPEYLLHFAWITGGDYLSNPMNIALRDAGINMLKLFKENGGKRAIYAGTCFEYDLETDKELNETTKINPKTLYAKCKNELHEFCQKYSKENNLSFGWGRIFYVYGHNEKSTRLTAAILDSLKNNKEFILGAPNNKLDYMYSKDIARAFVTFLESSYEGSVNICDNRGVLLKDYALKIQELMGKKDLIKFDENKKAELNVTGDNTILKTKIGYTSKYTLDSGLKEIISKI